MSKAYSNRALPAGTVLREWCLEEVLGVGGFGIVYKGRGIYFNELVAIKEYFPSSISERGEDETVVPIDSDAEEVHALGLKKFVEEAKLLWNLSTPTRHPNIVSVRSLFEIHGTAYMVMDFEDGTSLSRILKKGQRFNEASLRSMIIPIAEGLERAHRVGVLHRDIKPPNIIINDDGRSVLIDFGSARFESGEATSTKVTFHTPPYAAIEQYVRTFQQGPWTDIYALGVVLYECITGEKPAEVLERMHANAGTPLAEGNWPGFSKKFLMAVDKAMAIRPEDRPQTISEWLALLDHEPATNAGEDDEEEDATTRVGSWDTGTPHIVPVAPTREGFSSSDQKIETGVPDTPSKAEFKRHQDDTPSEATPAPAIAAKVGKEKAKEQAADRTAETTKPEPTETDANAPEQLEAKAPKARKGANGGRSKSPSAPSEAERGTKDTEKNAGGSKKAILIGGAAIALVAVAAWSLSGSDSNESSSPLDSAGPAEELPVVAAVEIDDESWAQLIKEAQAAGMPRDLLGLLRSGAELDSDPSGDPSAINSLSMLARFASATVSKSRALVASLPATGQRNAARARESLATIEQSDAAIKASEDADTAVASASALIASFGQINTLAKTAKVPVDAVTEDEFVLQPVGPAVAEATTAPQPTATPVATAQQPVSDASRRDFTRALSGARSIARQVIRLGDRNKPGSNATEQEKQDYRVRQGAAAAARDYEKYLDGLEASMRGNITDADAVQNTAKANQTRAYLSDLLKRSELTLR